MSAETGVVKGFSGVQVVLAQVDDDPPEEILDSGSTVKLMKSRCLVNEH